MSRLTKKGQVTILKEIRDRLEIKRGDTVEFAIKDGECIAGKKTVINIDKWPGVLGKGNTDELIEEIRGDKDL